MTRIQFILFTLFLALPLFSQDYCQISSNKIMLDNGVITREIRLDSGRYYSPDLRLTGGKNFLQAEPSNEFSFLVDDEEYTGFSGWEIASTSPLTDETGGQGVSVLLRETSDHPKVEVSLNYMIYPDLPIIRKWMAVANVSEQDIKLEGVTTEDFVSAISIYRATIYHDFARRVAYSKYVGDANDPLMVVHNFEERRGIALGNEAIGVLKRSAYNTKNTLRDRGNIEVGLTRPSEDFPFRKWILPSQSWEAPKVFLSLYNNRDYAYEAVNEEINVFMIKHMRPRIIQVKHKPTFVYNTWEPFNTNFTGTLMHELVRVAGECGLQEFVIDVGWHNNEGVPSAYDFIGPDTYGDWNVDREKFPEGLKPLFDEMRVRDIKPGLWMSVGSASVKSQVFQNHPEWFVKDIKGNFTFLQNQEQFGQSFSASFGTDWKDYIKGRILYHVKTSGLSYIKLDFAVVTSAYVFDKVHSGSYATDHPYYRDHPESFIVAYERLLQLFDELHEEAPDLFIDCTYETTGRYHLMDYATAMHADGNWVSNFNEASPLGPLRIRHLAWSHCPVVPASSLVIGNFKLDDPDYEFGLKSLVGTLPIVLGDLRNIPMEDRKEIKTWSDWLKNTQERYDYMSYRKDLDGFGEPREGSWDGWQRINFQSQDGGVVGVFKQGARESSRQVYVKDLQANARYEVKHAPHGKVVHKATGKELMEEGFRVSIQKPYGAEVFEISMKTRSDSK